MSVPASELLQTMKLKIALGRAIPSALVTFDVLVQELSKINPTEAIDIQIQSEQPLRVQYVRVSTDQILAELIGPANP